MKNLHIYNSLTRRKEIFKPLKNKRVNLFVCGPTVYDQSHIGHARTYIAFDVIVRYLRYLGYKVFYLQNITDIDDKIIARAKKENATPKKLAGYFEKSYFADMKKIGVSSVDKYARASDYIPGIKKQIKVLKKLNYAYEAGDGSIFFETKKFPGYGKLSGQKLEELESQAENYHSGKKNRLDFSLWKGPKKTEPWFPNGRPGWHIEDTAITEKELGVQYDIHGGARDLIFPHHESEIAQMEAISKRPLAKYWLHTGFLRLMGEKMSKSLGNFITIKDFLKEHSPEVLRLLVLSASYRSPLDYNDRLARQAEASLERLQSFPKGRVGITDEMNDDFNTPKALAKIFKAKKWTPELTTVFGLSRQKRAKKELPERIKKLIAEREKARQEKNWSRADELRREIERQGFEIKDTKKGEAIANRAPLC